MEIESNTYFSLSLYRTYCFTTIRAAALPNNNQIDLLAVFWYSMMYLFDRTNIYETNDYMTGRVFAGNGLDVSGKHLCICLFLFLVQVSDLSES